ncbi:MAG: transposase family protein [Candidatus Gracilibacteria bacterium]|nr:transposase family protein [Candidatus Gracilibacteria bacterium]
MNSKRRIFLLLPTFEKVNLEEENKRKIGNKQKYGGRKPVLETAEQKLFFILYYCKVYPTYDEGGLAWGIHRTMIGNWVLRYLPILQESLKRLGQIPPETEGRI